MLTDQERAEFVEAASAFISKKEKMELRGEQLKEQLGRQPGRVAATPEEIEEYMAPGRRVQELLIHFTEKYGQSFAAIHFRGFTYSLMADKGRVVGTNIWPDRNVEEIDG
jgi:hypothetical protein